MSEPGVVPRITLRIPGDWSNPGELMERLPAGFRLGPEGLRMPDGTEMEISPLPPDDQFARIFESACRRPAAEEELAVVARYSVNIGLTGAGGSLESALVMMQAGAAFVRAGGAGVFIDNSAIAHGGSDWISMTDDGGPDAISFAFTSIIRGRDEVYTLGMHTMGFADLVVRRTGFDEEMMVEIIRYACRGERAIDVGHVLADERGPRFHVVSRENDEFEADSPLHNPYGRLKLVSPREIAQDN